MQGGNWYTTSNYPDTVPILPDHTRMDDALGHPGVDAVEVEAVMQGIATPLILPVDLPPYAPPGSYVGEAIATCHTEGGVEKLCVEIGWCDPGAVNQQWHYDVGEI